MEEGMSLSAITNVTHTCVHAHAHTPTHTPPHTHHSGFSGVTANFFPWLIVWLCNNRHAPEESRSKVQQFLSLSDRVIAHKYPTSSKHYLATHCHMPIQPLSRVHDVTINHQDVSHTYILCTVM